MTKVTATALAGVMALGMLTACGGSSDAETTTATADTTASTASADAKKVKVGISAENKPYSYMNENEEYEGYEYAILCEVQNRIGDQYDMDIVMDEWTNLLVGIDTGNYAAAGGSFGYKEERAEKYSYSAVPILNASKFYIGYLKGRTDITERPLHPLRDFWQRRSFLTGMQLIRMRRSFWSTRTVTRRSAPVSKTDCTMLTSHPVLRC